ncbi:11708_t:CDS:2 [Diversispora eburnea]|uniref:11708_t:CDS:1 n=1 Tax=Diversispora eburnea TaxID=1213867 RepID=A0A9N9CEM3_9GLOM|nr:11708_t:CDS:2 [Diversispora eburnea]
MQKDKFKSSGGWVEKFKKWHNLKQYNMYGEASSAPLQNLNEMLLPEVDTDEFNLDYTVGEMEIDEITVNNTNEVQVLINRLNLEDPFSANVFIHYDDTEVVTEI